MADVGLPLVSRRSLQRGDRRRPPFIFTVFICANCSFWMSIRHAMPSLAVTLVLSILMSRLYLRLTRSRRSTNSCSSVFEVANTALWSHQRSESSWSFALQFVVHLEIHPKSLSSSSQLGCWTSMEKGHNPIPFIIGNHSDSVPTERPVWNFLSHLLLLIPHTCLPAAAVYSLWAFSVPLPSVVDISSYFCLCFSLFPVQIWR